MSICGFTLSTGPLCYDEPAAEGTGDEKKYCPRHEAMSSCVSCGRRASLECPAFIAPKMVDRCRVPLCGTCEHKEFNAHGPLVPAVEQARQGLIESMKEGLRDVRAQGLADIPEENLNRAAGLLIDHMALSVFAQLLSGMNMPR